MALTIENYLRSKFEYEFSDLNIAGALESWGIVAESSHTDVGEREKDLALSELYMVLANVTSGGGKRIQKGNSSATQKSYQFGVTDRANYRNEALRLRAKWGIGDEPTGGVQFIEMIDDGDRWL